MDRKRFGCVADMPVAVLVVVAGIAGAHAASAQDSGPIVVGTRDQLRSFYVSDISLALDLSAQFTEDKLKRADGTDITDREDLFREEIELSTDGFIGHPNLIEFDLMVGLRLEQQTIDSDTLGRSESNDELLFKHDARALILKESKTPVTIYSRRSQTDINRQFAPTLDNEVMEHGVQMRVRSDTLPSFFQYFHRTQEQTSAGDITDLDLTQDTFQWQTQYTPSQDHLLTWDYTYDNIDEGGQRRRPNSFERHDAIAMHSWDFGPRAHRSNLRSNLHYYTENGGYPIERLRWDENLRLRHTRKFETRYLWIFDQQEVLDARQTFYRGSTGFRHELFESLVTNLDAGASRLEVDESSFTSDQRFATLDFDYDKIVPYGVLDLTAVGSLNWQENSESGSPVQIIDESHTFSAADLIILSRRNVNAASIFMTDVTGIIIYTESVDYSVRDFGDSVEIRRILGGSIAPLETVLLDYRIDPEPGSTTTTTGWGGSARYGIKEGPLRGLSVYASYFEQYQDRDLDRPVPDLLPESDASDLKYGVEYDYENIFLRGERHHHDSTISPYDAMRLEARYVIDLGIRSTLALSATYDEIDRTDEDIRTEITLLSGRWRWQITDELYSSLLLLWRYDDDTLQGTTEGFEQHLDINWRHRQTSVYVAIRNSSLDTDISETENRSILVGLRREF